MFLYDTKYINRREEQILDELSNDEYDPGEDYMELLIQVGTIF